MKQLELELKERLLIVEGDFMIYHNGKPLKYVCKGSELTEEIAKGLVKNEISDYLVEWAYDYKNEEELNLDIFSCLESFISAIEAQGYYWGDNPIRVPKRTVYQDANFNVDEMEKFNIAEYRTFKPEKTLIFKII